MNGHETIDLPTLSNEEREHEPLNPEAHNETTAYFKSCFEIVFWKCKLWMILTSAFLVLILMTILSLVFYSGVYIDEDDYWDPESIANGSFHNFTGILKIHCTNPDLELSESAFKLIFENLSKRLTDVYSHSPALGRYFVMAEVVSFSKENNSASYLLWFQVPPENEEFMKSRMSEGFVMNILRQNIYDKEEMDGLNVPDCTNMTLDPTSLSVTQIQTGK
ncbi:TPA-induced transmembrane protein isoform X1 [Lacerta agilis]|uniref:TPA-induced transmembrane protein isoform X1 n=1 Tax=Lacerta agilis TaxID=80427 RepID=UPI0014195C6C|nr:TPA-induced transmembrane protein isoform X1 [Lacerta agilis]XP_033002616.1 TPA-induced transmembrane protein isoform X1 [Lacerta agilis]XP_033002617.1 TPA-induced transmembrane protein isoform X1 [Lacerta agilis]